MSVSKKTHVSLILASLGGVFWKPSQKCLQTSWQSCDICIKGIKKGKKNDFNSPASILLGAIGGNASAPTCVNSTISSTLATLESCSTNIESSCPEANVTLQAEVEALQTAADDYRTKFLSLLCLLVPKT